MTTRLHLGALSVAMVLGAAGCGNSPTEPSASPAMGSLVIRLTQPCPFEGSVTAFANNTRLGVLAVPGDSTFSIPAGSYSLSFVRGQQTFAASGQVPVQVPAAGVVVATDPAGACMSTTGTP